jgi:hypothetical protein
VRHIKMERIYEFSTPKIFGATYKLSYLGQTWLINKILGVQDNNLGVQCAILSEIYPIVHLS